MNVHKLKKLAVHDVFHLPFCEDPQAKNRLFLIKPLPLWNLLQVAQLKENITLVVTRSR